MKNNVLIFSFILSFLTACSTPEEQFIDGCLSSADNVPHVEELCSCTYKKLETQYGQEQMEKVISNPTHPQMYQMMESSIEKMIQCAEEKGIIKPEGYIPR